MAHTRKDGYKVAKDIEREWFLGSDRRFQQKTELYHKLRKYARGEHDVETSKAMFVKKGEDSFTNYDFSPIQLLPKFKDKLVNDALPQLYNVEANAVDKYSTDLKDEERDRLLRRMVSKPIDEDMKNLFGVDMEAMGTDDRPNSEEEIDLRMSMSYKSNIEIATELATKYTFELNDYDEVLIDLLNNAVDLGRLATKTTIHPNKGIVVESMDPAEMVWSFCKKRNHSDAWYYGERVRVTIGELQNMTNGVFDISKENEGMILFDEKFLGKLKGKINQEYRVNRNESETDTYDSSEKLDLLYYTYKTVIEKYYKKKTYKSGRTKITEFKGEYNGQETQGFEVFTEKKEVWYEGYLLLGSEYSFGHGLVQNLSYKKDDRGIQKVISPIRMYSINLYEGKAKGMIERSVSIINKIQNTEIKLQQLIAAAKPSGIRIDVSKINNIEGMDYKQVMKIYNETGNEIYTSGDGEEGTFSQGNIHELRNGVVSGILDLVNIQNNYLNQLREALGIPQGADASSPDPRTAVAIQNQVVQSSAITSRHILDSVLKVTAYTADSVFERLIDVFKYHKSIKQSYLRAIGKINIELVESLKNITRYDLGIFISLKPDAQSRAQLENNIALAIQAKSVDLDTAQEVRYLGESNTKLANQLLKIRRQKREKKIADRENEKIELNGEQQRKLAKDQAEAQQNNLQVQLTIDQSRIQSEAEAKIAMERELSRLRLEELEKKFGYDFQLKQLEVQNMTGKLQFQEDSKNKRQDKNNTDTSTMIEQKDKKGPSHDFTEKPPITGFQ